MRLVVVLALFTPALAVTLAEDARSQYPLPTPLVQDTTPAPIQTLRLMSPFPVVRIVGRLTRSGARIRLLTVRAPASVTIFVRCFRRGCRRRSATAGRGSPVRFRRFERTLRAGTVIEVFVGRGDAIGKYTRFRIRRGRRPARLDLCLRPGATSGTDCPEL